jgi:hypothetical protein
VVSWDSHEVASQGSWEVVRNHMARIAGDALDCHMESMWPGHGLDAQRRDLGTVSYRSVLTCAELAAIVPLKFS